jgi:hypothetical protein
MRVVEVVFAGRMTLTSLICDIGRRAQQPKSGHIHMSIARHSL